jgi:hypothetical protein
MKTTWSPEYVRPIPYTPYLLTCILQERVFPLFRPILEVYGKDIIDELDGHGIHSLENVLTLQGNLSYLFNTFGMWLTATVRSIRYPSYPPK